MTDLAKAKCVPCRGGEPTLKDDEIKKYLEDVENWQVENDPKKIVKEFEFENFKEGLSFTNKVGELAENEGHHPNIYIHSYNKVKIELWTHKIGGLHKNDFVMAAKIDKLI